MKEKVLISRKRLMKLENMAQHYKTMEDAVKLTREMNQKLTKRNIELIRSIDNASFELKELRSRTECISDFKARNRSINYLAAYAGQITDAVMRELSSLRFCFFETKINKEDLQEIESEIRRTIHNIFFI